MIIFPNFMGTLCNKDADYEKKCVCKSVFAVKTVFKRNWSPAGWTRFSSLDDRWRQQCEAVISGEHRRTNQSCDTPRMSASLRYSFIEFKVCVTSHHAAPGRFALLVCCVVRLVPGGGDNTSRLRSTGPLIACSPLVFSSAMSPLSAPDSWSAWSHPHYRCTGEWYLIVPV